MAAVLKQPRGLLSAAKKAILCVPQERKRREERPLANATAVSYEQRAAVGRQLHAVVLSTDGGTLFIPDCSILQDGKETNADGTKKQKLTLKAVLHIIML